MTSAGKTVTLYYNTNLREWEWVPPYSTPIPSRPGEAMGVNAELLFRLGGVVQVGGAV